MRCLDPDDGIVVKAFRSSSRDEPAREWTALSLLARFAPGLAPAPLSADLRGDPPVITMSRLPGTELAAAPVTPARARALSEALERLWGAVPPGELEVSAPGAPNLVAFARLVREKLAVGAAPGDDPDVARAYASAVDWLRGAAFDGHDQAVQRRVLGHGDPNLANFLWDGGQVRLVDFEDSGPSDRAFELALLTEHLSAWSDSGLEANSFLGLFDRSGPERGLVHDCRRLAALFWLLRLRPGSPSSRRNPPGTLQRQADRLRTLLDSAAV